MYLKNIIFFKSDFTQKNQRREGIWRWKKTRNTKPLLMITMENWNINQMPVTRTKGEIQILQKEEVCT